MTKPVVNNPLYSIRKSFTFTVAIALTQLLPGFTTWIQAKKKHERSVCICKTIHRLVTIQYAIVNFPFHWIHPDQLLHPERRKVKVPSFITSWLWKKPVKRSKKPMTEWTVMKTYTKRYFIVKKRNNCNTNGTYHLAVSMYRKKSDVIDQVTGGSIQEPNFLIIETCISNISQIITELTKWQQE